MSKKAYNFRGPPLAAATMFMAFESSREDHPLRRVRLDRAHCILNNETWNYTTFTECEPSRRKNLDTLLRREIKNGGGLSVKYRSAVKGYSIQSFLKAHLSPARTSRIDC